MHHPSAHRHTPRGSRQRTPNDDDEMVTAREEVDRDLISPNPDVFSYFMLKAPAERKEHNKFTVDAGMSYGLVFLTLAIQGCLLYCVYNKVIGRNTNWQNGIMNTGKDWNIFSNGNGNGACNDGNSLCSVVDGIYTCAPPTVQLISHWDELDLNKDGIWSNQEVKDSREILKCKYAVDPVEVFGVLIRMLNERKEHIWLNKDIKKGTGIHKSYFNYIKGDIALCGYRNEDMCGNLLKHGVFDAPLRNSTVPRVGGTIRSALDYCRGLLEQGGLCERVLPSTYATWKIESVQECQEPKYNKFVYTDPSDGSIKSLLEVDYEARQSYATAKTTVFRCYKFCIVFIWFILIASRMREVAKAVTWVWTLPSIRDPNAEAEDQKTDNHEIRFMSLQHRVALFFVITIRMVMLLILLYVGLNFLGRQNQYIDLLLDGVALMFIVEVAEILYERVLRQEVRTTWEEADSIELPKLGISRPDIEDVLYVIVVTGLAVAFLVYYNIHLVEPLYDALKCTCLSEGENCQEAHTFSKSFWDQYWTKDVPASIQAITKMKLQEVPAAPKMINQVGRQAVNLLKFHHQQHIR